MTADKIATWTLVVALFGTVLAVSGDLIYTGKWMGVVSQSMVGLDRGLSELKDVVSKLDDRLDKMDTKFDARFNKVDARVSKLTVVVSTGLAKLDGRVSRLEGDVSEIKTAVNTRLPKLEQEMLLHRSASGFGQSSSEATEPPSATVTPKRKLTKPSEETKVPPRARTP